MAQIDDDIDALYRGPLDAFIDARNQLAKASKRADVKAFAKPSLPAWAVNQLYWHHRAVVERLEAASTAVREAHQNALAGKRADIGTAEGAHRDALREALAAARTVLTEGGHALTPGTLDAVRDTLQALPAPDANGRLAKPLTARGLDALAGLTMAARPGPIPSPAIFAPPAHAAAPAAARKAATPVDPAAAKRAARDAEKATREAEKTARERQLKREKAEAALAAAREALAEADGAVERAERDLEKRQTERAAAREGVKKAQRLVEELSFGR